MEGWTNSDGQAAEWMPEQESLGKEMRCKITQFDSYTVICMVAVWRLCRIYHNGYIMGTFIRKHIHNTSLIAHKAN